MSIRNTTTSDDNGARSICYLFTLDNSLGAVFTRTILCSPIYAPDGVKDFVICRIFSTDVLLDERRTPARDHSFQTVMVPGTDRRHA